MRKKKTKSYQLPLPVKLTVVLICLALVSIAGFYFLSLPQPVQDKAVDKVSDELFGWRFPVAKLPEAGPGDNPNLIAYSDIRDPGGIPEGLPVRLKIPVIGVDTAIEDAYITPDGRMDVPTGSVNVAWFSLGPPPGEEGSAVIGGHYGIQDGVPFVFYNLDKLKAGDKIYVEDDKGDTLAFVVRSTKTFNRDADATEVFTSDDGLAHLNLITCEGIWNQVNDTYPDRLVVFTDAIPSEGPVVVRPKSPAAEITPPVVTLASPPTQTDPIVVTPINVRMLDLKSLFATPLEGLVTSLLLMSILFLTFKIIRR